MVGNWIRKCQLHLLSMSCIQCVRRDHLFGLLWGYAPTKQSAEIDGENRKRSTSSKVSIEEESNIAQDVELYSGIQGELLATTHPQEKRCGQYQPKHGVAVTVIVGKFGSLRCFYKQKKYTAPIFQKALNYITATYW
jgi:hypothetical protein